MDDPRILNERRRFITCRNALEKLARDDGRLLRLALDSVRKWEENQTCHERYVRRWRELLAMPVSRMRQHLLVDGDEATALQQNHPFAGFFSPAERIALRQVASE